VLQGKIRERFEAWSAQGYRVLGVAVKFVGAQTQPFSKNDEMDMAFAGFLLFFDPPKDGVKETIQAMEKLGVRLKVITGDNQRVAHHIGQVVGLGDAKALTGSELDNLRDEALWHAVEETTIFAEVDPNEKERIILALKKLDTWWVTWATASTTRPRCTVPM
jgi:Mg2+-importing ATPase